MLPRQETRTNLVHDIIIIYSIDKVPMRTTNTMYSWSLGWIGFVVLHVGSSWSLCNI